MSADRFPAPPATQPPADDDAAHAHELLERSGSVRAVERMMGTARTRSEHAMAGGDLPPALVERLRAWAERELGSPQR